MFEVIAYVCIAYTVVDIAASVYLVRRLGGLRWIRTRIREVRGGW